MFYGSNEVNGERESPDGESQLQFPKVKQKVIINIDFLCIDALFLLLNHFQHSQSATIIVSVLRCFTVFNKIPSSHDFLAFSVIMET